MRRARSQAGMTLIEVLMVLGIFILLSAAAVWYAVNLRRDSQVEQFVEQYQALAQNVRTRYRTPDGYVGLTYNKALTEGQIPDGLANGSTANIGRTPWGTDLDLGPGQAETDLRAANQSFMVTVSIPDSAICTGVLMSLVGRVQRIRVGTTSRWLTGEPFTTQPDRGTIETNVRFYCSESGHGRFGDVYNLYDN